MSRQLRNLPPFERVNYFYGQLLGVREFRSEQSYFFDKHRLHNRYLHGYGVVCGLDLRPCGPADPTCRIAIEIDCGLALDCIGNEIVVSSPIEIDLLTKLDCDARKEFLAGKAAYISVCFVEQKAELVRPLSADSCGALVPDCVPSRLRDDVCVRVSLECPKPDRSCSPCSDDCVDPCLLVAEVRWCDGRLDIDASARRPLGTFVPTRIKAVSWVHDGTYHPHMADRMLADGLTIHFTDDVHVSTLRRGVVDVWVVDGGSQRHADITNIDIEIAPGEVHDGFTRSVRAHTRGDWNDRLDPGDRVLIQFRSAFVLDRCCRPVDGENVGGLVPQWKADCERWPSTTPPVAAPCARPGHLPWTSGNGIAAGNFESWFYLDHHHGHGHGHGEK